MPLLNFFRNIWRYKEELYNDYDYDYVFLLLLLRKKLILMEEHQLHNSMRLDNLKNVEEIKDCVENINIYLTDEDPSSPVKKERDETHLLLEKYAKKHNLNMLDLLFKDNDEDIKSLVEKYHELNSSYFEKIEKNQKEHLDKLFDDLKLNIENWWD